MEVKFKTNYKTGVKVQYGVWNPNEHKYITVYKYTDVKPNPIKR